MDALDKGSIKLSKIDRKDLPENMQKMTQAEQQTYVDGKRAERQQIQNEINNLNNERKDYLAKRLKDQSGNDSETLDSAMTKTIQSMMAKKDFQSE